MNDFDLERVKLWCDWATRAGPVGDAFLDARYEEQVGIIGHVNPYYRVLWRIARELRPALSVELGSWQATAAAHLAGGWPAGRTITIDIHREDKDAQARAIEAADHYPNLFYINAWTWDALPQVAALGTPIDVLFVDAWHEYQYVRREWELYEPLLADTALVVCDDVFDAAGTTEGMLRFWDELPGAERFTNAAIHPGIPMGFLKYMRGKRGLEPDRGAGQPGGAAAEPPAGGAAKRPARRRAA